MKVDIIGFNFYRDFFYLCQGHQFLSSIMGNAFQKNKHSTGNRLLILFTAF